MTALTPAERRYFAAISLACAAVLMAGGWLFWQAGTGQVLVALGLAAVAVALVLDRSRRTVVGLIAALVFGMLPILLGYLLLGLSKLD